MKTEKPRRNGCRPGEASLRSGEFWQTEPPPDREFATEAGAPTIPLPPPAISLGATGDERSRLVPQPFSAFGSLGQFEEAQRMALMLARSSIVPENYRGEEHIGDCVIALEIANRIGASVLAVMQNLQPVGGKPGWSSQFLISCVNATKRFSPLRYQMTGTPGEDNRGCIAWARDNTGELLESPEVTIQLAKDEGWYYRPGSRWKTLPELMLRYRSATLFTRLYAPEITMGIQTTEEVVELSAEGYASGTRPNFAAESANGKSKSGIKPAPRAAVPRAAPVAPNTTDAAAVAGTAPKPGAAPDGLATPLPSVEPRTSTAHYHYLKALKGLIGLSPYTEVDVLAFLHQTRRCDEALATLAELAERKPETMVWIHDHWNSVEQELTRRRKGKTP